jgi:hypothetical protein
MKRLPSPTLQPQWIRAVMFGALGISASGLLLFLPPFSLPPFSRYLAAFHKFTGFCIILPFFLVFCLHGIGKKSTRTSPAPMRSGVVWGILFLISAGTGVWICRGDAEPWLFLTHIAAGAGALILGLLHGIRK